MASCCCRIQSLRDLRFMYPDDLGDPGGTPAVTGRTPRQMSGRAANEVAQ